MSPEPTNDTRPLRIAVVTGSVSRLAGGFFTSVRRSAQSLQEAGHEVTVLSFRDAMTEEDLPAWQPLKPRVLDPRAGPGAGLAPELGRALRRERFDVVHQHGIWRPFSRQVMRFGGRSGPVMISPRGMLDPWALGHARWKKAIAAALYENDNLRRATCLHALTDAEAEAMRAYGLKTPVTVIPNGVDLPAEGTAPAPPPWWPKEHGVLLFMGRIHPKKGALELVEALARLTGIAPRLAERWRVVIAGWDDGGHLAQVEAAVARNGLKDRVLLPGPLFGAQKEAALRHADAFVLPSRSEGLPVSVLEAWSFSLPVLMTPACNLPEGFAGGAAIPIETAPDAMARTLAERLGGDRDALLALGRRGRALVAERYAWSRIADRHAFAYRSMVDEAAQSGDQATARPVAGRTGQRKVITPATRQAETRAPQTGGPRLPVSVVVPVKNEERNLPACLDRLAAFAEVIVVDSGSTDRTVAIAKEAGARVIQFRWNGRYPKKRNHVLMTERLAAPWVLFLDADEQVSEAFVAELAATLGDTPHSGFWLNYTNYFMEHELKHGVPQRKLALFKVGEGLYERIDGEAWSALDMEVHEHPIVRGSVGEIAARIDHRDLGGLDTFLERHLAYARWEAGRFRALRACRTDASTHLTTRQRFKYRHMASWWYPLFYFLYAYVVRRGFLDGRAGLGYALQKAWYFHTIAALIAERRRADAAASRSRGWTVDRRAAPAPIPEQTL